MSDLTLKLSRASDAERHANAAVDQARAAEKIAAEITAALVAAPDHDVSAKFSRLIKCLDNCADKLILSRVAAAHALETPAPAPTETLTGIDRATRDGIIAGKIADLTAARAIRLRQQ